MKLIIFLLMLLHMSSPGNCSDEVLVLKYKGGMNCTGDLVGVPTSSLLEEFTFCGKYYFRFLHSSVLMGIEPDLILNIENFEKHFGFLMIHGDYYRFDFHNQTVTPDSWQYICLAVNTSQMKIVWNGEILFNHPKPDLPTTKNKNIKLWLGGALFSDQEYNKRLEGMIAKTNVWNTVLQDDYLISITTNKKTITSTKYDLYSITTPKNSTCIDYLVLDENDDLFQESHPENHLIEYKTNFLSANYLCQGYGGQMTIPINEEDMTTLDHLIQQSEVCDTPFLGLIKSSNDEILDLKDNPVPYWKWASNQPNGGETQKCINILHSYMNDDECDKEFCFTCQILQKSMYILRGPIPADTERKYFVTMSRKNTEIRGITETECFWKEENWNFGKNLKLDNATNNMPPVGLKTWNNGQKFKFTQCKKDEFTCHTYGHCISMNKRCDGNPDCPIDGSDENECKIMTLGIGYDRRYSSEKNLNSHIYIKVYDITDIDEMHMSYTVNIKIELDWHDSRIIFRNLHQDENENTLNNTEIEKIWTPQLYIEDSNNKILEAGQKGEGTLGVIRIFKKGSPHQNELSEIDEDYLYNGTENAIGMINYFVIKLGCKFDLKWYPFDIQRCPIKVKIRGHLEKQFVLNWRKPPRILEMELTQYDVHQYLEYENYTSTQTKIGVEVILCRKLYYHIFNTYIPTLVLIMIAGFTLFIDFSHFEVSIMIALTSMLVTYTLYQSISAYLPRTSYMKMIDIWLFGGLIFPFFIIAILVIMDSLIMKEKNLVIDFKNEEKRKLKSTIFMKSMQVMLLTIGSTLCIAYWIVGLYHYYTACPI